jgi:paraquat-inducible protein A
MVDEVVTALSKDLVSCHLCCKLSPGNLGRCPCCGARLHQRKVQSLQRTTALLITSSILYIPANIYPIMETDQLGATIESSILGGVVLLLNMGSIVIAAVIFIASVMVPLGKFLALYYLVWSVKSRLKSGYRQRTQLYRLAELIGKWSMVDVFVVAILVALVHLGGILVIRPGVAAISFAGVVIITMLAAHSFDPRLIWDQEEVADV